MLLCQNSEMLFSVIQSILNDELDFLANSRQIKY
nr:MAG TPA: hypothetical protein [Caudoviricetes sp.]